ncbi:MAG TPA: M20/M25/M40 family metallo-hydrolase [Rhizomicrobium sp.]|jgi:hypothetical protein|nr:M20/M25/M40 family metallo-hydrolase [Rhizomicrobium sp.]
MKRAVISNLAITIALLIVAAGFWFLQTYGQARPDVAPVDASLRLFSAARAEQVLARILGPEKPHPVSTAENVRVRARIVQELQRLGLHPAVHGSFACHPPRVEGFLICATINDVIADVRPGTGKAIILLAHYDSVPAGPGAADDESGVAAVIETARALIARGGAGKHPVMAVLTDGEEADLLGAAAFLRDPALKARIGAVVNVEARGNRGPSFLFQTSPGDGPLVDIYADNASDYATSSLYHEIYRFLPNDTDLTLFIGAGFPSFNFAYVGGVFDYHTALDTRANLDPVSLQQQGDSMLGVASGLEQADFGKLRGEDDIYLDILGRWLPRMPASRAVPLAAITILLLLASVFLTRGAPVSAAQWLRAFAVTPVLLFVAVGCGFLLHAIAVLVSGMPDPSYAHPAALRIGLSLELAGCALLASRFAPVRATAAAVWLWIGAFGVVVAIFLPGLSPYFLIPALVAAFCLLAATATREYPEGHFGIFAVLVAASAALLVWSSIGATGETIMGLKLHPMFTVPFAIALSTIVPLLARFALPRGVWIAAMAVCFAGAVCAAFVQGLEPPFSTTVAQRLSISYVASRERAFWTVDAMAPVPAAMRNVAAFSPQARRVLPAFPRVYAAPAGDPRFPVPDATVIARPPAKGVRRVTLLFHGSEAADQMFLIVPKAAVPKAFDLHGSHYAAPAAWSDEDFIQFACMSRDCRSETVTLTLATRKPLTLGLYEHRFGLPGFAHRLVAARPPTAVPSQNGDGITLVGEIHIPAT